MGYCRFPIDHARSWPPDHSARSWLWEASRLLRLSAWSRFQEGDPAGAYEDTCCALRLARGTREPLVAWQETGDRLVEAALNGTLRHLLERGSGSPTEWKRVLTDVDCLDRDRAFVLALKGLRARGFTLFEQSNYDPQSVADAVVPSFGYPMRRSLLFERARGKRAAAEFLRSMTDVIAAAQQEPHCASKMLLTVDGEIRKRRNENPNLVCWIVLCPPRTDDLSVFERYQLHLVCKATVQLARVALAMRLYEDIHGMLPKCLSDLAPSMLPDVPADPFTGRPFGYRLDRNGRVLYSVGPDLGDDGAKDIRYHRHNLGGDGDIVWRLDNSHHAGD